MTTWYQSEPGLNTLGSWEVVFTTVGLLCMVRTLHIDNINVRTYVFHLCENGIKLPWIVFLSRCTCFEVLLETRLITVVSDRNSLRVPG